MITDFILSIILIRTNDYDKNHVRFLNLHTRRYIHDRFVDLHKVEGLRGVYIASQLTAGRIGRRHILSKITFDKGGLWQPIAAPKKDNNGRLLNCSLVSNKPIKDKNWLPNKLIKVKLPS